MNKETLKQISEEIPVPESLKPEQIEKKLIEHKKNRTNLLAKKMANRIALTAASLLLLLAAGNYFLSSAKFSFFSSQEEQADSTTPAGLTAEEPKPAFTYEDARKRIASYLKDTREMAKAELSDDVAYETYGGETAKSMNENSSGSGQTQDIADHSENLANSAKQADPDDGYSDTNRQVEGVDEGDIVKTDGKYIYVCSSSAFGSNINIYEADGKNTKKIYGFRADSVCVYEMYLHDGTLALVGSDLEVEVASDGCSLNKTSVLLYNVSDVSDPVLYFQKDQSGNYSNSRMNGKYLYTISNMRVSSAKKDDDRKCYIPCAGDDLIPEDDIHCPNGISSNSYVVLTSLDITKGDDFSDTLSVLGGDGICYASENNIYIAAPSYSDYGKTTISKYHYEDGRLEASCEKTFRGTILNQFSLDEYDGNLRFVATTYSDNGSISNGLYVLDKDLELLGSVDKLARSERIYSARFLGDTAYFVTYRETDPVFMVDLTDPSKPVVKDKLKLPGFSEYLHPFGDNLLLGLGSNINSDGDSQVKLSMFDISSASSVKELHTKLLAEGTESIVSQNHKAVLISRDQNLIGFCTSNYYNDRTEYQIYSYDSKKGFRKIASLSPKDLNINSARGLYIGDYLYLVDGEGLSGICVYDRGTMKMVKKVK